MILTIWTIQAKPGKIEELRRELLEFDLSDRPAGCKEVLPLVDFSIKQLMAEPDRPDVICIMQRWTTLEAANSAGGGDRRMQFMDRLGQYIQSASVRFYQPLAEA